MIKELIRQTLYKNGPMTLDSLTKELMATYRVKFVDITAALGKLLDVGSVSIDSPPVGHEYTFTLVYR